eukprot:4346494-Pleurochrysis_carterae.AAC.1
MEQHRLEWKVSNMYLKPCLHVGAAPWPRIRQMLVLRVVGAGPPALELVVLDHTFRLKEKIPEGPMRQGVGPRAAEPEEGGRLRGGDEGGRV